MQYAVGVPLSRFDDRPPVDEFRAFYEELERSFSFNHTNENVDWADFTHNPITGCLHDCAYCYAWYQAEDLELYKQGFQPTFFPGRLSGFSNMEPPDEIDHPREKNVFVGSMSDMFGNWVPNWMIQSVLDEVEENDGFDYLFLTKFPQKLSRFDFPDNAWVGTTVDKKHRVDIAERNFKQVDAPVKWLSCEPLLENVAPQFDELSMFDCVVIGAQQEMGQEVEEKQPKLEWVIELYQKAREAGCKVYFKENLDVFPKELPEG
jgi:protein gp37